MRKLFLLFWALLATTCLWAHDFEVDGIYYNYLYGNNVEVTYRGSDYDSYDNEYSGAVPIPETVTYNGTTYSVTSIGNSAFCSCLSLTSITIPNSVTSIGGFAFQGCSSLKSITIPNSVTSIGTYTFYGCSSLASITIPNSVTSIGEYAFYDCSSLPVENNLRYADKYLVGAVDKTLSTYSIKEGTKWIGSMAFSSCRSLASITIPNSVTSIGAEAFSSCRSLASITIPNSVTSIGAEAFSSCSSLTSITIPNSVTSIGDWALAACTSLTSITIPNSVTSIGAGAFDNCTSLTSITIPNSVTSIGDQTFYNCSSLTSITIPNSVTSIGDWALAGCSSLTSVTIGNIVTSIGDGAFYYCTSLISVTCEAITPPTIGGNAFYGVSKSIPVYVPCGSESAYKAADGWKELTNIQEPQAEFSIQVYTSNSQMGSSKVNYNNCTSNQISATPNFGYHFVQWSDGNTDNPRTLVLTQDTTLIAEFAQSFSGRCGNNLYWAYNKSDQSIAITGTGDMYNYTSGTQPWLLFKEDIKEVTVANTATSIGTSAFEDCPKLTSIIIPNSVTSIGNSAFRNCSSLTSVTIPNSVTSIERSAFSGCPALESVVWNAKNYANPTNKETAPFYDICSQIKSFTFGEAVEHIPAYLCYGMENLTSITTPNSLNTIGTSAFEGCIRLSKISLGTGLKNIAANAFAGCTRLYDIYTYATYPPFADESSFANYNVYVYVPCEYQRGYTLDVVWGKFKFIECIESEDATTDGNVAVDPGITDVTITWPTESNAETYTIVIKKDGEVFCTLTFNAEGQLLNIAFAPGRDGKNHPAQYAVQTVSGYRFTVTGLEEGTHYTYNIDVRDAANKTINSHAGEFTTQSITAVDNIQSPITTCPKVIRNGQLIILRDGKTYTTMGAEIQ